MKSVYIVLVIAVAILTMECIPKKKVNPKISETRVVDTTYDIWSEDSLTIYSYSIHGKDTAVCAPAAPPEFYERAEKRRKGKKNH